MPGRNSAWAAVSPLARRVVDATTRRTARARRAGRGRLPPGRSRFPRTNNRRHRTPPGCSGRPLPADRSAATTRRDRNPPWVAMTPRTSRSDDLACRNDRTVSRNEVCSAVSERLTPASRPDGERTVVMYQCTHSWVSPSAPARHARHRWKDVEPQLSRESDMSRDAEMSREKSVVAGWRAHLRERTVTPDVAVSARPARRSCVQPSGS